MEFKTILAFGNPLLDISVSSPQLVEKLIKKFNLENDGQREMSKNEMQLLNNDIQSAEQQQSPGGCCQNSLRVLQWILNRKCNAWIFGSVGNDRDAKILQNLLEHDGVNVSYISQEYLPTGKAIALTNGPYRSLVVHLGAAEHFPLDSLLKKSNFNDLFDQSDIIFIEAYFLTNDRFETAKYLVDRCKTNGKFLVFNLCGVYIFPMVPEPIKYLIEYANLIFGNLDEFKALKVLLNYESIEVMAKNLINNSKKVLVVTNGADMLTCYHGNHVLEMMPPIIEMAKIKDTTGAGDAFIGGYLAGLCTMKTIVECIEIGFYAASAILEEYGCTLPSHQATIFST